MGFNTDDLVQRQFDTKTKQAGAKLGQAYVPIFQMGGGGS